MKDVILLYEDCCIYEIVILNYFLKCTGSDSYFCSVGGDMVRAMEGYLIRADLLLKEVDPGDVRSFILPGGEIRNIDQDIVMQTIRSLNERKVLIGGICAGVDVLYKAGILDGIRSIHSVEDCDCIRDGNVITARANAYVDFAIEMGKALELFEDEADLQETIDFWRDHRRVD